MFKVDIQAKKLVKLEPTSYGNNKLLERFDIQEWIDDEPSILGNEYLIIGKEVILPSNVRLDLLAIDKNANLVIIELKRDDSGKDIEWQAIKYASYCAGFTDAEIYNIYENYLKNKNSIENAKDKIKDFLESDGEISEKLNKEQKIILVSRNFHSNVASAVLWLRDYGVDISCLKLEPFLDKDNQLFIKPSMIIPLPEAKDYIIRKEIKEKEDKMQHLSEENLSIPNHSENELKILLTNTLKNGSVISQRLMVFIQLLLSEHKKFDREEIKEYFYSKLRLGETVSRAGTYLSNVSQCLTRKDSGHLRQIISFDFEPNTGAEKNNYYIRDEYRELVQEVIDDIQNPK